MPHGRRMSDAIEPRIFPWHRASIRLRHPERPRRASAKRLFGLIIVAATALSAAVMAATPEEVRGTVASVTADSATIHTVDKNVTIGLTSNPRY
jgi:hypothetical protein